MKEIDVDILIIGSGLIGLVAAHCLSSLNYSIAVVDKKSFSRKKTIPKDIRTVAVSEGSKVFLESLSLWSELKKYTESIKLIKVFDRHKLNKILFHNPNRNEKLGYVIENSRFSKVLRDKIQKKKNVRNFYGSSILKIEIEKELSKTYIKNQIISSKLIIAADGKNSNTREIFGTKIFSKKYKESAFVVNFLHEKTTNNTAYEIFYNNGPLAILPMKSTNNHNQSSIIWSNEDSLVKSLINCNNKFLEYYIYERVGDITGKIKKINSKQTFPLSAHINETFIDKRLIYIGDSAHSVHPIAGQGWNLGIKDVKNLYHLLKNPNFKNIEIGSNSFCKKYNDLSYKNAFQLYQITDKLNAHFKNKNQLLRVFSAAGFKVIEENTFLKNQISKFAMGF